MLFISYSVGAHAEGRELIGAVAVLIGGSLLGVRLDNPPGGAKDVFFVLTILTGAGSATTSVALTWTADAVELRVVDSGDGGASPQLAGAGHGLIGMGERIRVVAGELEAGPRADGGFGVVARLPLAQRRGLTPA